VSRFVLPHFTTFEMWLSDPAYRLAQGREVRRLMSGLIATERPDVVFIGSERYALDAPAIAEDHGVPIVQRMAVATRRLLPDDNHHGWAREVLAGCRKARRLVAPARHVAEDLRALGFSDVSVIPSAVDTACFAPRPKDATLLGALAIAPDALVVAHVANLRPVKRSLDIVAAAREALRRDSRIVYLIVGDGIVRRPLEEACRAAGIDDRFRFVGWVDYAEVPRYLNLADLVVTSSETEGLSRVYLETQACGRVLIASDIPAAREVVEPGHTGLLFPRGDPAALAAAILRAAGDARLRTQIGRNARARVVAHHALPDAVTRHLEVLTDVVATSAPSVSPH
jgi:glycosyltransferase involved in cell wall biosynthesis